MLGEMAKLAGEAIGTVAGIAIAPLSIALNCSKELIQEAIKSGCKTEEEIRKFVINKEQ